MQTLKIFKFDKNRSYQGGGNEVAGVEVEVGDVAASQ